MVGEGTTYLPDRSGWLTCIGLFEWFLACLCLVKITFLLVPPDTPDWFSTGTARIFLSDNTVVTAGVYAIVSALLFAMGIGTHKARRWARSGMLVFSWGWLIVGLMDIVFSWQTGLAGFCFALLSTLLPIPFLLFLRSPSVKATFDYRDPRPRWKRTHTLSSFHRIRRLEEPRDPILHVQVTQPGTHTHSVTSVQIKKPI